MTTRPSHRIFERTLAAASAACDVPPHRVTAEVRIARVFRARAIIAWLLVRAFEWSPAKVGLRLGRCERATTDAISRVDADIANRGPMRTALANTIEMMLAHSRAAHGDLTKEHAA